jgi:rubrerythrin
MNGHYWQPVRYTGDWRCASCGQYLSAGTDKNCPGDPVLPYNGTSGWSGTDTSKERAVNADKSGETSKRQREVIAVLDRAHMTGLTWKELSTLTGWHHGKASGVLSVLHKANKIARLTEKRDKCRVYVHLDHVGERDTDSQGRKHKCPECGHKF